MGSSQNCVFIPRFSYLPLSMPSYYPLAESCGISRGCVPWETQSSGVFLCVSTAIRNDQALSYWTITDLVYLKRKLNWDVDGWSWQSISSHRKWFESLIDLSAGTGFNTSCLISFRAYWKSETCLIHLIFTSSLYEVILSQFLLMSKARTGS